MKQFKDPVSGLTHLGAALLSLIGLVILIVMALQKGTIWHIISFPVFGVSLICLYTASSIYHLIPASESLQRLLRQIDHMMIFVLIAGSYTPFCLGPIRGIWGYSLLITIWTIALLGIIFKIFWMNAPRWLYTGFYLFMGWLVIIAIVPLIQALNVTSLSWLIAGGLCYTIGAVFYGTKWPKIVPSFGFHEIWHIFVMFGSFCHYISVVHTI